MLIILVSIVGWAISTLWSYRALRAMLMFAEIFPSEGFYRRYVWWRAWFFVSVFSLSACIALFFIHI